MKDNFEKPIIIIEGDTLYGRLQPNAVRGALASVIIDLGIPIIWTKNPADTKNKSRAEYHFPKR